LLRVNAILLNDLGHRLFSKRSIATLAFLCSSQSCTLFSLISAYHF
jgi:hypothetical protein